MATSNQYLSEHQKTLLWLIEGCIDMTVRNIDDSEVYRLMKISYGRVVTKDIKRKIVNALDQRKARHVADWLHAAVINQEPWLKHVDDIGRPKKLMKLGSLEQLLKEADKAMIKAARKHKEPILRDPSDILVEKLSDDYTIVQMTTPEALDEESRQMQHCIGGGAYDKNLTLKRFRYLSLRDAAGKSHVTIEVCDETVLQIAGKQNEKPTKKYMDILVPFLQSQSLKSKIPACDLGYVIDTNRNWHLISAMPENMVVEGDLQLRLSTLKSLPENLTVLGSLGLWQSDIETLPKNLVVEKSLNIEDTRIKELPNCISIGGSLYADNSSLETLPQGLKIGYRLGGDLSLSDTKIKSLPPSLRVYGSLSLRGLRDFELPENLHVEDDLYIEDTNLTVIPDSLEVQGDVHGDEGQMRLELYRKQKIEVNHQIKR